MERKTPWCPMMFVALADPAVSSLRHVNAKCIGSLCAWWWIDHRDITRGRCCKADGCGVFLDPARQEQK
jgi:hypothetical protein